MVKVLWGSCKEAETESAGMPKQKVLVSESSLSTREPPMCVTSRNVPDPQQPALPCHQHWDFSDIKRKDMQKAEKGKVYLLFENTFHLIVSLAKKGNLRLQEEKQGKKQG